MLCSALALVNHCLKISTHNPKLLGCCMNFVTTSRVIPGQRDIGIASSRERRAHRASVVQACRPGAARRQGAGALRCACAAAGGSGGGGAGQAWETEGGNIQVAKKLPSSGFWVSVLTPRAGWRRRAQPELGTFSSYLRPGPSTRILSLGFQI